MNCKLAIAVCTVPFGMVVLLAKSASAAEVVYQPDTPIVVVAQRYDDRGNNNQRYDDQWNNNQRYDDRGNNNQRYDDRQNRDQQEAIRREEIRRNDIRHDQLHRDQLRQDEFHQEQNRWSQNRRDDQRVWIAGHYESGFLGIGRRWVDGYWATGR